MDEGVLSGPAGLEVAFRSSPGELGTVLVALPAEREAALELAAEVLTDWALLAPRLAPDVTDPAAQKVLAACESDRKPIASIGLGRGGTLAFLHACRSRHLQGVAVLAAPMAYEALDADRPVQPLEMSLGLECPLLALFGEEDDSIPRSDVDETATRLDAFAKPHELEFLPNLSAGALDPQDPTFDSKAARQVWTRVRTFLEDLR